MNQIKNKQHTNQSNYTKQFLNMKFIKELGDISINDVSLVGGKTASLGEMYQSLRPKGINIPPGFAITVDAFNLLIEKNNLEHKINTIAAKIDSSDIPALSVAARVIRSLIKEAEMPLELIDEINMAYKKLSKLVGVENCDVAVRSSATAEDLPGASFAGQQETFLNIQGETDLIHACKNCFASLYTDRAISYRVNKGFRHSDVRLSICVQRMVRSDLGSSGVIFSLDPESGARNVILVTSAFGLGENVVAGKVDPDEFIVQKDLLEIAKNPIIRRKCGAKQLRLIYSTHGTKTTKNVEVSEAERKSFSLTDHDVVQLAKWTKLIESHYTKIYGKDTPMDIEWGRDGRTGELFILQARPETVHAIDENEFLGVYELLEKSKILLNGTAVGTKIGAGAVRILKDANELSSFKSGEVLVADMTDPDWEPVMKKASAIITNRGGRTCHAAIVSREHGVPCLVGTGLATTILSDGQKVTVSSAEGEEGHVYDGVLKYRKVVTEINAFKLSKTKTKVMVNLGNPSEALKVSLLPVSGVGLARMEFIINSAIKIHPMALVNFDQLNNAQTIKLISEILGPYKQNPEGFFIDNLAEGIAAIAGAFYPRSVVVRFSDFKTNEYSNLIGGEPYEPKEENPMIGFRGACRYYHPDYKAAFGLECKAILKAREEIGLTNIKVMIPFCRSPEEGKAVLKEMSINGLRKGENGLEVYVMAELPANIMNATEFAKIFDGFSIGSNDLTQMVLGVDRDSNLVSNLFNERDEAVTRMISMLIQDAKLLHKHVSICGQAPSDYPDLIKILVTLGIDSISVTPDAVFKTLKTILDVENENKLLNKDQQKTIKLFKDNML
jgi:pyruvate, water dikinase